MIAVDERICTGCRACEFACSFQKVRTFHYKSSMIRIQKNAAEEGFFQIGMCRHCSAAPCMPACLAGAIARDPGSGLISISPSKCTGCGQCVDVCPWHAPAISPTEGIAKICDLCQGDPSCVKFCQPGALALPEDAG